MRFTLEIRMTNSEGVLERILGRLRQRNLHICGMVANLATDQSVIDARFTVDSLHRAPEPAVKQLGKLYDVLHMRVHYPDVEQVFHFSGERNEVCLSV